MANLKTIELVLTDEHAETRIDRVLAGLPEVGSRAQAARLIEQGAVTVDGAPVRKSVVVTSGAVLRIEIAQPEARDAQPPAVEFSIAYEDSDLMIIDKPAGLVVHPGPGNRHGTLSQALAGRAAGGDPERPGIVHRLDKDTSGLLVVARSDQVLRELQQALQRREIARRYTALVMGAPDSATGTIDAPLGRDRRNPENIAVRADAGRDAVTHFEIVEQVGPRCLLHVNLETGRTHQIRVHLAAIGLPVCGDPQYGIAQDLGLARQFLHASELSFRHPVTKQPISVASPLPADLHTALEKARAER